MFKADRNQVSKTKQTTNHQQVWSQSWHKGQSATNATKPTDLRSIPGTHI